MRATVGETRAGDLTRVLGKLAQARLVLMESGGDGGATIELTHESLIERWPTLVAWLAADQDAAEFRSRLRTAARQWDKQSRSEDLLWRGQAADEARRWLVREDDAMGDVGGRDRSFLLAVVALAARTQWRKRWAIGAAAAAVAVLAVVFLLLAMQSDENSQLAEANARAQASAAAAKHSAILARNASRMASALQQVADPTLILALLREMEPAHPVPRGWREWTRWATRQNIARLVLSHDDPVTSAAFSPDGTHIVTAAWDNNVQVWSVDRSHGPVLVLKGHDDLALTAAFNHDGTQIVTGSLDKTARIWNADGSGVGTGEPVVLRGHEERVYSAAFSPDGARVVTGSYDGTARIWNADGTGEPIVLKGHDGRVYSAEFSRDGTRVVTASIDKTARVWNADGSGAPVVLEGHKGRVFKAVFSPDGQHVLTISQDKTLRMHNADGWGEAAPLRYPELEPWSVAFSPDGTRIASVSHNALNETTGEMEYGATVGARFTRFTGLDDPSLWTATSYCPPIEVRTELLGVPEAIALKNLNRCQERVKAAFAKQAARQP